MEHFGLKMQGTFIVETVPYLKDFVSEDIGRFIYVEAEDNYYFGTTFDWIQVGLKSKCVKIDHIDFGHLHNQINAVHIPFKDTFLKSTNVSDALKELSSGKTALKSNSIFSNHLSEHCVNTIHLNCGISETQISAKDIPIISLLNANITDTQTAIQKLEEFYTQISRPKISISDWDYNFIEKLYVGYVTTNPIINAPMLIQCYNTDNEMIFPKKVILDTYFNRAYIYHTAAIELNVILMG